MTRSQWTLLILGIAVFLAAFGIAFASQHLPTWQVWQTKDGTAALSPLNTLSSGDIVVSFDSTGDIEVVSLGFTIDPLLGRSVGQTVWFHNDTDTGVGSPANLRPIDPCHDAIRSSDGAVIGRLEAEMWDEAGNPMGSTCWDVWEPNQVVPPGEMWKLVVWLRASGDLMDEDSFDVVFGAVGQPLARIAFVSDRDGNSEIYVMDTDGSNQTNLTNNPSADSRPYWSPDGAKIAFESNRDGNFQIYVMNADGSSQTRLTGDATTDESPAWSPDGTKIAFQRGIGDGREIYVMTNTGANQTRLTNNSASDTNPAWSPDGSKIAFNRSPPNSNDFEIYTMTHTGGSQTNLTSDPAVDRVPDWSPDGSKIVFTSDRDGNDEIYVMDTHGSNPTRLTNNNTIDEFPNWSLDGSKMVFSSRRDGNDEIYIEIKAAHKRTRQTYGRQWQQPDADHQQPRHRC